ncbi:MAG: hypothetical protein AB7J28_10425 [Hyphomonadaceae bacterium]
MNRTPLRLAALGLAASLALAGCASGDRANNDDDTRMDRTRRGIAGAATMPLRDVGLIRPDIPEILENLRYPYSVANLAGGCPNVQYEIGQLDAVLGSESYQPAGQRSRTDQGLDAASNATVNAAEGLAGDVVPFRGWVRRLSGAQRAERRYAQAIEMGQMRRAFLRGYGSSLGCRAVVPAPPPGMTRAPNNTETNRPPQPSVGAPR